jgi:hypothetical protein
MKPIGIAKVLMSKHYENLVVERLVLIAKVREDKRFFDALRATTISDTRVCEWVDKMELRVETAIANAMTHACNVQIPQRVPFFPHDISRQSGGCTFPRFRYSAR